MIRKDRGFVFATEWGLNKIRSAMMESILNLIWDGKHDERMRACIPAFYLENMAMDEDTLNKLKDKNSIRQLVKHGLEGRYSNGIGDAILADVEKELKRACAKYGLDCQGNIKGANPGQGSKFCAGVTG